MSYPPYDEGSQPQPPPPDQYPGQPPPPPPGQYPGQQPPGYPPPGQPGYPPPQYPGYQPGYQPYGPPPDHPQSTLALILGIVSVVVCQIVGPFALVIGKRALNEIDASGGTLGGRGMAQAGYILGIIGTVLLVLVLLYFVFIGPDPRGRHRRLELTLGCQARGRPNGSAGCQVSEEVLGPLDRSHPQPGALARQLRR